MAEYTLECFDDSGNSYKVALMLNLCAADWEPKFVDFYHGETNTPEFRERNVMGEVPLLRHGELVLSQSGVILDYLAFQLRRFGPRNDEERREILRWLFFDNHKLSSYCAMLRIRRFITRQGEGEISEFLEARARAALSTLNLQLGRHEFVTGDRIAIADISLCSYLYFGSEIGIDLSEFPRVRDWLKEIKMLDGWLHPYDLMPGPDGIKPRWSM